MKYEDEYIHIINTQGHTGLYDIKIKDLSKKEDKSNTKITLKKEIVIQMSLRKYSKDILRK